MWNKKWVFWLSLNDELSGPFVTRRDAEDFNREYLYGSHTVIEGKRKEGYYVFC